MFAGSGLPDRLDGWNGLDGLDERLEGMRDALATFASLLRCELIEATDDHRASHARGKPAAIAEEPRSAAPMYGRRIEAQRRVVSSLAISSSNFWSRALRRSCLPKPHLLRWTMPIPSQQWAAERPVLDEPKAIGPCVRMSGI